MADKQEPEGWTHAPLIVGWNNDGSPQIVDSWEVTGLRELLASKSTAELVSTIRSLAADYRLELMPAKFRYVMQEAANRLEQKK
jgi:hypothetical protein